MKRLHLGCGPVYLKGYTNIDIKGLIADKHPKIVAENLTTVDKYFKKPFKRSVLGHNKRGKIVVDLRHDITQRFPFNKNSVDEIFMVNVIDHMPYLTFSNSVPGWRRILKHGGKLIIAVNDVVRCAKVMLKTKDWEDFEWGLRLIYCHSRDMYDAHHWGYTPTYLKHIFKGVGFKWVWTKPNYVKFAYPGFTICFEKI